MVVGVDAGSGAGPTPAPAAHLSFARQDMVHVLRRRFTAYLSLMTAVCKLHAAASAPAHLEATSGRLTVSVDPETGRYSVSVNSNRARTPTDETWLVSAPTMLHSAAGWLNLSTQNASSTEGSDENLGNFTRLAVLVSAGGDGGAQVEISFRVYHRPLDAGAVIVAEQRFLTGATGVKLAGPAAHDLAASAFPNWQIGAGLLGHRLQFIAGCDGAPSRSPVGTVFPHGYASDFLGRGLPLALLDSALESSALVMSPVNGFVSSTLALHNMSDGSQTLAAGIVGSVDNIPADFAVSTVMTMSRVGGGFTESMMHWGDTMLALGGGKRRTKHNAAPMVSHLGYSTTAL